MLWKVRMPALIRLYDNRIIRVLILALLAAAAVISVYQGVKNALHFSQDLQWDAARALGSRLDPYELSQHPEKALEDPGLSRFYEMFEQQGSPQKMEANQFPSLLMLLAPIALIPPETARVVWCVLNLLFTAGIILVLRRTFLKDAGRFEFAVLMLLMLAGTPYRNQLGVGQHTLFSFFFFMLAVFFDMKPSGERKTADTVLISLCLFVSYFKYTLTAPLCLYFVYRKRYREIAVSAAAHVVLTGAAALWLKKSFIYMIKAPLQVASALTSEGGIDLGVIFGPAGLAAAAVIFLILAVIALRLPAGADGMFFAVLVFWSLVLVYHRTYDFFVLSAAASMFYGAGGRAYGTRPRAEKMLLAPGYAVVVAAAYFVLRIFGENTASMTVTGILYYLYTIMLTVIAIRLIRFGKT